MEPIKLDVNGALYVSAEKLEGPCVIVVSDGKAKMKPLQAFGTLEVIVQDNKVSRINNKESIVF